MKFRHQHVVEDRVELQMTPMIDIVFQLLVFFIMSFKIAAQEGDFNVKMPLAAPSAGTPDDSLLPPLKLRLLADENGQLRADGIQLNDRVFADFSGLRGYIRSLVGDDAGPGQALHDLGEMVARQLELVRQLGGGERAVRGARHPHQHAQAVVGGGREAHGSPPA